ncbi:hypothetical protein BH24DEI2_BH24DEI2_18370 [soil metagenome]
MNDREFVVIASRLVWGEFEGEPSPQDTLKRLKALVEEREHLLGTLKAERETVGSSRDWDEPDGHVKLPVLSVSELREVGESLTPRSSAEKESFPDASDALEGRA